MLRYNTKQRNKIRNYFQKKGVIYLVNIDIVKGFHYVEIKSKEILESCFSRNNILKRKKDLDSRLEIIKVKR